MFFGGRPGIQELIVVLVIALIIFGPRKLPEIGSALGKSLREFKKATNEMKKTISLDVDEEPAKKKEEKPESKPPAEAAVQEEPEEDSRES